MGSTHVVEQLYFSLFLSIKTFDFDSILGLFLTLWGPNGLFLGLGKGTNTVLGSTHVVRVASVYFLLGSILMRDSVHTDREKVSTKASYYTDKHLKRRIKCYFALIGEADNLFWGGGGGY